MTEERSGWPALWALVIGFFMILVDTTIVTVGMPAIMAGLDADVSGAIWVTSAYLLAYAVPLLVSGRLGDRFGPRRVYLIGLSLFTLASLACGLAPSIEVLIFARVVQGLGASLLTPQTMAVITRTFPPDRRGPAMGLWGSVAGVAVLTGPLLGGVLIDTLGWEWIFFVNLPVGVIAFAAAWRFVPRLETHSHRFDWIGVLLSGVGMFCLVFGIEEGQSYDWGVIAGPVSVWSLIITGLVVMAAFVFWQRRVAEPLVPLSIFADRNFTAAGIAICAMGFIVTSQGFPLMLYAQSGRGLTPTQSALLMIPIAVISAVLAPIVGSVINRRNPRNFAVAGFGLLALGLAGYALLIRSDISVWWLLVPSAMVGLASAGIWGPLSVSATRNLPPRMAGAGSGVYNTMRQIGAVLGSAAMAAYLSSRITANLGPGAEGAARETGGVVPPGIVAPFSAAMAQSMWLPAVVALVGLAAAAMLVWRAPADTRAAEPARAEDEGIQAEAITGDA